MQLQFQVSDAAVDEPSYLHVRRRVSRAGRSESHIAVRPARGGEGGAELAWEGVTLEALHERLACHGLDTKAVDRCGDGGGGIGGLQG
jgi:hypothetical protein